MAENYLDAGIEKALAEQGEIFATNSGISMYPMLRHRKDMIVIERIKEPLKRCDVPLYRLDSGKLVLHRILKVTPECYIIRGDNLTVKEYIKPEQVIGVLKEFYRNGKRVDCKTSKKYKLYVFWIMHSYWLRYFYIKGVHPILIKVKHLIFKDKKILKR